MVTTGLPYLRRRRSGLAWLLLPALLLRALIPAGFMPMAGVHGMSIELCPGGGVPLAAGTHSHAGHSTGGPGAPGATHHAVCLFSTVTPAPYGSAPVAAAPALPAFASAVAQRASLLFLPTILRAQSSRGPPSPG